MSAKLTPESVVAGLSAWKNATISELGGGLTNRTLLLECDGRKAVLKIDEKPREAPFNSRLREAQIQSAAVEHGLATAVIRATDTVIMTEYAEGIVWSSSFLEDNANLESLAGALRRMHAMPLSGHTFDAMRAAREYIRQIESGCGAVDASKMSACLQTIEAAPRSLNLCFCHNDLVVGNIINTPEVRFLDWEYACDNDPFFDLATIVAHHQLSATQSDYLLDAYFDGGGVRWREQLAHQVSVYEALCWLWQRAREALPAIA